MKERDNSIDVLRGISIVIMFYAHLLPFFISGTTISTLERVVCSFAAPIFLFLVGFNFSGKKNAKDNLVRGAVMLLLGAFIDAFVFSVNPFASYDILYFIGLVVWVLTALSAWKPTHIMIFAMIVLGVAVVYQYLWSYRFEVYEPNLGDPMVWSDALRNLFFDGWFPFFPWMFFPLIGIWVKRTQFELKGNILIPTAFMLISGFIFLFKEHPLRAFSIELFYPADLWFVISTTGVVLVIWKYRQVLNHPRLTWLSELGRLSLFLYLFHLTAYQIAFAFYDFSGVNRLFVYSGALSLFLGLAVIINRIKRANPSYQKNQWVLMLLGS
jgi:uncharacterized membrane protein